MAQLTEAQVVAATEILGQRTLELQQAQAQIITKQELQGEKEALMERRIKRENARVEAFAAFTAPGPRRVLLLLLGFLPFLTAPTPPFP